ncbi:piercer of microtubule wall 1 protein-like [Leucoraja erinacea]|uniref:piercer of microtubule wall 1 protein-like n=1 Tax=Leucoraja erinaceus TaxID=7782 RepID=UPI0024573EC2|nr:piercer of microtubule wall 1 protein-like [Leucoraja erinacea]
MDLCGVKEPTVKYLEPKPAPEPPPSPRTSHYYRVKPGVPDRFEHPNIFQGYRSRPLNPIYRTTNQIYGSQQPTVHEMPTSYFSISRKISDDLSKCGMYKDNGFNVDLDKTLVTGPDNLVKFQDRLNFHRSYLRSGTSETE